MLKVEIISWHSIICLSLLVLSVIGHFETDHFRHLLLNHVLRVAVRKLLWFCYCYNVKFFVAWHTSVINQVCLEGQVSKDSIVNGLSRGKRASGDLIPWTVAQQYQDQDFPMLSGARIVRIATHPDYQGVWDYIDVNWFAWFGEKNLKKIRH